MLTSSVIYPNGSCGRGSLGGFFTFAGSPVVYGISNNHVIANINNCAVDDPIYDESGIQIGSLKYWMTLNGNNGLNLTDVALFAYNGAAGDPQWRLPGSLSKPLGYIEPRVNGHVYMMCKDSSQRQGIITAAATNVPIDFTLCGSHFLFTHLIEIASFDGNPFSVPGNSGSVLLSSNDCIVGLVMGTNPSKTRSYAVPFVNGILKYYPLLL